MANWQKKARLFIALGAVAFAVVVAFAFRSRVAPADAPPPIAAPDPKAIAEGQRGTQIRLNRNKEEINLTYQSFTTYQDGCSKLLGVRVVTERSDRLFTITGDEGSVCDGSGTITLSGNVAVETTDGLRFRTDRATYLENEGIARAPGRVEFSRGRMQGSAFGMTYEKNVDIAKLEGQVVMDVAPEPGAKDEAGGLRLTANRAELSRPDHVMRFERGMRVERATETIEADGGVAYLTPDDERLDRVELRGNSRITGTRAAPGALQAMTGRDIDLKYAADGVTLQQADILADAVIQIAGEPGQAGRRISANTLAITLAPDGTTPLAVAGRDRVELRLPAEASGSHRADRTIRSRRLDATGEEGRGLTRARFSGSVEFHEQGRDIERGARSEVLDVALAPGLSTIEEAQFTDSVRFVDGPTVATAAAARYLLDKDLLELRGGDRTSPTPHVVSDRVTVDAATIDVTMTGPVVRARGNIRSEVRPETASEKPRPADDASRMPSMLKPDQPVIITAADLVFDKGVGRAVYTGTAEKPAVLNQGESAIKAHTLSIDEKKGDLSATGQVTTVFMIEQERDGKKERVASTATADTFAYLEENRRATYTGRAHLAGGAQGDLTADRIELFLKESGNELDRVEAYDHVIVQDEAGKTTGQRFTYRSADEVSVLTGSPVVATDKCGREQKALKLTYDRRADRITFETATGQPRTQGAGRTQCP